MGMEYPRGYLRIRIRKFFYTWPMSHNVVFNRALHKKNKK